MVRRHNRLLVALYVCSDALLATWAFILAYGIRFESGLIPVYRGYPPIEQYLNLLPFVAVLTPFAFWLQGVYRLRRGRSRVDDFFAVLIGSILSVVFGVVSTLYFGAYYASDQARDQGAYQVSQLVWALFLVLNVLFTYVSRETVRELLERRWRAGIGLKRILIAGAGDLGRLVADRMLQHRELGFQVVGFIDDRAGGDHIGYRGLPLLGTLAEVGEIARRERADHLYVTLPLEEHAKLLDLMDIASREFIDVKVVPDLLQFIALRARLEDLDGLPVINLNEVPLQGFNTWLKRGLDVVLSVAAMIFLAIPFAIISALVKWTSPGPVFYKQERMGLDGKAFTVYKFRSMHQDAEEVTGPVWARDDDPRATRVGRWLRQLDLDELPQFWNVLRGEMSIVGPRPERPFFVEQFKHRIPQYMLRHKVKAGITGWAQVNGWRGNTSLEKRIEYDLYYIENWSVTLDLKIMWLTLVRGLFQRGVAY
ncbi:MAG TPA: undecaprenyl-phosphate glucose phosphotransferase [Vicinamibacterales bacterium]|nr:undecaprenyl-phosphate glucose phosphotransferase [Vicinamibacterales bacterium]